MTWEVHLRTYCLHGPFKLVRCVGRQCFEIDVIVGIFLIAHYHYDEILQNGNEKFSLVFGNVGTSTPRKRLRGVHFFAISDGVRMCGESYPSKMRSRGTITIRT